MFLTFPEKRRIIFFERLPMQFISRQKTVVKGFLLFKEGDVVNYNLIYESGRILRDLNGVRNTYILPKVISGNQVTASVYIQIA